MIALQDEPTGETYKKLIEYALRKSDAFSLVFCNYHSSRDYEKKIETLRDEMRKFLLKSRSDPIWPGTVSYDTRHKYIIDIYCASKSLLNFLVAPERLFGWNYPDAAEDIAFFKNGKCWFSHVLMRRLA